MKTNESIGDDILNNPYISEFEMLKNISIDESKNNIQLAEAYNDKFMTQEQKKRDKKITKLLKEYVDNYQRKVESCREYRHEILITCCFTLIVFTTLIAILFANTSLNNEFETQNVISLVTACVTYLGLVISILKIITSYVFPKDDEQYITRIVELIQNNDLANKQENIKSSRKGEVGE